MSNDPVHNHPDMAWDMAVPDGWKLVPVEPTEAMKEAGEFAWMNRALGNPASEPIPDCYKAMLAAAPRPPIARSR